MKIQTQLKFFSALALLMIGLVATTLFVTTHRVNVATHENQLANEVIDNLFELGILTTDYLLYGGERAAMQWQQKQATLTTLLLEMEFHTPEEVAVLERIRANNRRIGELFTGLTQVAKAVGGPNDELRHRYVGQLGARTQAIATDARSLTQSSAARRVAARQRAFAVTVLCVVLLTLFVVLITLQFDWNVVRPLHRLHVGTEVIGSGNLDHKVGTPTKDEIGQLSRAFDEMTARLKTVTVSRDELAREVAQRQRAERELERSNRELELFAYTASHDLQEPLRAVAGFVDLLRQRYAGQLDERGNKFIDFTVAGVKRMQNLIQALLEYSRVSTHAQAFGATDLQKLFDEAAANLQVALRESGARLTHDPLPVVHGDASQLGRLLQNLISNAIKFRREDSPTIHVSAQERPTEWEFAVRDNGIGIEAQYFERVFGLFQRLHSQDKYPGTGLGLAICKRIVERHNGRIWVESTPGSGTTFHFTIPKKGEVSS